MALTDLKKNSTRSTKQTLTVDEFIADAENYAMGQLQPAAGPVIRTVAAAAAIQSTASNALAGIEKGPMRHATFTLSQQAIDILNALSQQTGVSKSKLLRQLILQLDSKAPLGAASPPVVVRKIE